MHPYKSELIEFLDERLGEEQNRRIDEHLAQCQGCQEKVAVIVDELSLTQDHQDSTFGKEQKSPDSSRDLEANFAIAKRFVLRGEIARGGMGVVYRGFDRELKRDVAIKIAKSSDKSARDLRFAREAQISGQLQHPGIVPVHQTGVLNDGRQYIAMKLVNGQTLMSLISDPDRSKVDAHYFKVFGDICNTMAYAHSKNIVHRDLKPDNVMVGEFGEVQIMDWGLAKKLGSQNSLDQNPSPAAGETTAPAEDANSTIGINGNDPGETKIGQIFGTPAYMPPEQAKGELLDKRADVFAMGGILFQILTGKPPFDATTASLALAKSIDSDLNDAFEILDQTGADPQLIAITKSCLASRIQDRPLDAQVVNERFSAYLELRERNFQESKLEKARTNERLIAQQKRNRQQFVFGASIIAALVASSFVGFLYFKEKNSRIADQSRIEREGLERKISHEARIRTSLANAKNYQELAEAKPTFNQHADWTLALKEIEKADSLVADGIDDKLQDEFMKMDNLVRAERAAAQRRKTEYEVEKDCCEELFVLAEHVYYPEDLRICNWINLEPQFAAIFERLNIKPGIISHDAIERLANSQFKQELIFGLLCWRRECSLQYHDRFVLEQPPVEIKNRIFWIRRLVERADPDPFRTQIRLLIESYDNVGLIELSQQDAAVSSVLTVHQLAAALKSVGIAKADFREFFLRAQQRFPKDFFVNWYLPVMSVETDQSAYALACYSLRPNNPAVLAAVGNAYMKTGKPFRAIASLEELVRIAPYYQMGQRNLAKAYDMAGQFEKADKQHDVADSVFKDTHESFKRRIKYLKRSQAEKAQRMENYLDEYSQREGFVKEDLGPKPLTPEAIKQQSRLENAIAEKLISIFDEPGYKARYRTLASHYRDLGQLLQDAQRPDLVDKAIDQAIKEFRKTAILAPEIPTPYEILSGLCEEFGRLPVAIDSLEKAIAIAPNYGTYYKQLSQLNQALILNQRLSEQPEMAKRTLDKAVKVMVKLSLAAAPGNAKPHEQVANFCKKHRRYADAIEALERAIQAMPDYRPFQEKIASMNFELAKKLRQDNRYQQANAAVDSAILVYRQWAKEEVDNSWPHKRMALSYEFIGNFEKAKKSQETVIEFEPKYKPHQEYYAKLSVAQARQLRKNDLSAAIKILEGTKKFLIALDLGHSQLTDLHDLLSDLYSEQGSYTSAIDEIQYVIEKRPGDFVYRERLGQFHEAAGQTEQAEKIFRELIAESPNSDRTVSLLAKLYADQNKFDQAESLIVRAQENGVTSDALNKILSSVRLRLINFK